MAEISLKMFPISHYDYRGKTVLLRLDINSPIDRQTKKIVNTNRLQKSLPTLNYLLERGAKVAIIAHQGDTLDYHNLIAMEEHAQILSDLIGDKVDYIDDVCGPAAIEKVKNLKEGKAILLGNLRYLSEEISTFETVVALKPEEMLDTYLVRSLKDHVDIYVNDAFAAAHRKAPSMVAFQEIKSTAAGILLEDEVKELTKIMEQPKQPSVFVLGGLKISDAFGMMEQVLKNGSADQILVCGVTGNIMLMAQGYDLGQKNMTFIREHNLEQFIAQAKEYLDTYSGKIITPEDIAYEENGKRAEIEVKDLPVEANFLDIGTKTVQRYEGVLANAGTIFYNGPAGVYENPLFEYGTKKLWEAVAVSDGYSVIGGGDTVTAASKFIDLADINYVCTAGGAMVRFLSGVSMPLLSAMKKNYLKALNN